MAQHDYSIANQGFPATRADINNVLSAIATNNSGTSAPSTQYAGQFWIDTTSSTWTLYIHDGADDIQFATIDTSANTVNFIDSALDVITDTTPQLGGNLDVNGNQIISVSNGDIVIAPNGTGKVDINGNLDVDSGTIKLDGNYPTGTSNVALGNTALDGTSGGYNVAIGDSALSASGAFNFNTAVGFYALNANTGSANTAVGRGSLQANTSGANNTAVGQLALTANTTASNNTAVGFEALQDNTTGTVNTAMGRQSLQNNTTGSGNTAYGHNTLNTVTTSGCNTAVGGSALFNNTGANNTAVGHSSLVSNTTGERNVGVGTCALYNSTTATNNTALGFNAINVNTTGASNTAVGKDALLSNTTASNNTAVGVSALSSNTTGNENVAVGRNAGLSNTVGNNNVSVGAFAGHNITTGGQNINIGGYARVASATENYSLAIGYNIVGKGAGTGYIAPDGTSSGGIYQGNNASTWSTTSDKRIKKNIVDNNIGLDKISQIQVKNFEYRTPDEITELPQHSAIYKQGVQVGVIAQEIEEILPDIVKTESTGVKSVNPDNIIWYLVNAIKELKKEIDLLKNK